MNLYKDEDDVSDAQELDLAQDISLTDAEEEDGRDSIMISFIVWLSISLALTYGVYFKIRTLYNMDVLAHTCAGIMIAAFIFKKTGIRNSRQALLAAMVPFIVWEFFEFGMVHVFGTYRLHGIFYETFANKIQDISMDTLGFLIYIISTGRKL